AAAILLAATWLQRIDLLDICLKNIDEAAKVIPRIKEELLSIDNKRQNLSSSGDLLKKRDKKLTVDEFLLLVSDLSNGRVTIKSLISWSKYGNIEESEDVLLNDFLRIMHSSFRAEGLFSIERQQLEEQLKTFISEHQNDFKNVNAALLHVLCIRLIEL